MNNINNPILSTYAAGLPYSVQRRYVEKISEIGFIDPFSNIISFNSKNFPPVSLTDIYNYFVSKKSAYTHKDFKAYKSLESYNYFISKWITEIQTCQIGDKIIVRGKVSDVRFLSCKCITSWESVFHSCKFRSLY